MIPPPSYPQPAEPAPPTVMLAERNRPARSRLQNFIRIASQMTATSASSAHEPRDICVILRPKKRLRVAVIGGGMQRRVTCDKKRGPCGRPSKAAVWIVTY